ncbi:MAG: S1 RNA-binding domain-containing protein [Candidatus Woesearchaeota archaeon]
MLLKKEGLPEEGELVICTVTNVQSHCVFAKLDEYGFSGMVHISEIAPGRIRNIRDYVKEGKIIVCKILRVNRERGQIDLSLRRVSENQHKVKINEVKQEQRAEKMIETAAKELKADLQQVYSEISKPIFEKYPSLFACFTDVVKGNCSLEQIGIPKKTAAALMQVVVLRLKPQQVVTQTDIKLQSYAPDGVEIVKRALKRAVDSGAEVKYIAAGSYRLIATAPDYKSAEKILEKAASHVVDEIEKSADSTAEVVEK